MFASVDRLATVGGILPQNSPGTIPVYRLSRDSPPSSRYNAGMTRHRPGYARLEVQIPDALWNELVDESTRTGESLARLVTTMLRQRYKVPQSKLPVPRRPGRKPRRK